MVKVVFLKHKCKVASKSWQKLNSFDHLIINEKQIEIIEPNSFLKVQYISLMY